MKATEQKITEKDIGGSKTLNRSGGVRTATENGSKKCYIRR